MCLLKVLKGMKGDMLICASYALHANEIVRMNMLLTIRGLKEGTT